MSSIWTVRRSTTDHKVSGLCGGIAQQWGVDPVLVRVGCVLLALSGGIGVVLYLAGWLMIPLEGQQRSQLDEVFPQSARWPREVKVVIVAIACVVGAVLLASVLPFGLGSALILAAIWYFGYYKNRSHSGVHPPRGSGPDQSPADPSDTRSVGDGALGSGGAHGSDPSAASPPRMQFFDFGSQQTRFTEAASAWQQRIREHQQAQTQQTQRAQDSGRSAFSSPLVSAPPTTATPVTAPVPPPPSDREAFLASPDPAGLYTPAPTSEVTTRPANRAQSLPARRLRLVSIAVLGLTMAGLGVASAAGVAVGVTTYLAAALLVAGLTLVAAAWFGRAAGILPIALLLAVATTASAVGGTGLNRPGVGAHSVAYPTSASMPAADRWQTGAFTVDLSNVQVSASREYDVHVESGRLKIIVPPQARVSVTSSVQDGYLKLADDKGSWGSDLTGSLPYTGPNPSGPVLDVRASVDQGMVEVQR